MDSEGASDYWSLQARFFSAGGVEVEVKEAVSVTIPGHSWIRVSGIVTKPLTATTMHVELVSKETSGWVTFDDIYVLKAPPPLIPPPPTSVKYYYFNGMRVAMRRTNHDTNESTLHYLHADHLGSTRLVTDENGDAISNQGYFAFGSERSGGPIPTDHSFTGQKVDRSGLLYYNARYYDPELGQFVSPDTIVPEPENVFDYNRFMYVRGNAINFNDPSGHTIPGQCIWCNDELLNYSDTPWLINKAVDGLATVGCFFAGCHVDRQNDTVTGPTNEEYIFQQSMNAIGMNTPLGMVKLPGAGAGSLLGKLVSSNLSDDLAYTFSGGKYTSLVLGEDTIMYRAGTQDRELGQFFSLDVPISEVQTRIDKAVLPQWPGGAKSPIDTVYKVKIPAGTTIHIGEVGYQNGFYIGGTQQIVVEQPWNIPGVEVLDNWIIQK